MTAPKIPKEVQRQIDRANEISEQVYPPAIAPIEEPILTLVPTADPIVEAAPVVEPAPVVETTDWEHKYRVLDGKYKAEVPRLFAQVRELNEKLAQRDDQLSTLLQRQPQQVETVSRGVKQEDIDEYGEDLVGLIERIAESKSSAEREELRKLKHAVSTVNHDLTVSARDKLFDALDNALPTWNDINTDPRFLGWLAEADPYSGNTRGALLQAAFTANDSARVLAFFKGYLNENATIAPVVTIPMETATPRAATFPLETLLTPGGVAPNNAAMSAQRDNAGRMYTRAQIKQFYNDISKGRYKGRDAERDMIERDIIQATREGRISN